MYIGGPDLRDGTDLCNSLIVTIVTYATYAPLFIHAFVYTSPMTLGSKSSNKPSRKSTNTSKAHRAHLSSYRAHIPSQNGAVSGSSSSRHVVHSFSRVSSGARITGKKESLTSAKIQARTTEDHIAYQERLDSMSKTDRSSIAALHLENMQTEDDDGQPAFDILDILSGQSSLDISHIGGEFADLLAIGDDLLGPSSWYVFLSGF